MLTSFKEEFDEGFQGSDLLYNIVMTLIVFIVLFFLLFGFLVPPPLPLRVFIFLVFFLRQLIAPQVTLLRPLGSLRSPGAAGQTASHLLIDFRGGGHHLGSGGAHGGRGRGGGSRGGGACCFHLHIIFLLEAFC